GEYARARPYLQDALAMYQALYPKTKYPQGHCHLANSLDNLGAVLLEQGEYGKALNSWQESLVLQQRWLHANLGATSQAPARFRFRPGPRHVYLPLATHRKSDPLHTYTLLWQHRALLSRFFQQRHAATRAALLTDPDLKGQWEKLRDVRQRLAFLLARPLSDF